MAAVLNNIYNCHPQWTASCWSADSKQLIDRGEGCSYIVCFLIIDISSPPTYFRQTTSVRPQNHRAIYSSQICSMDELEGRLSVQLCPGQAANLNNSSGNHYQWEWVIVSRYLD